MKAADIERRIFVVGVPRSGTTLVQSLLAAHSELTSFTESHFFSQHFNPLPWMPPSMSAVLTRDPAVRRRTFLSENGLVENSGESMSMEKRFLRVVPTKLFLPLYTRSVARQLLATLDELASLQGLSGWIEKTPKHLHYVAFLESLYGNGQPPHFVHVIRDGLAAVASLHKASQSWSHPYDLETCVARWNSDLALSLARVTSPHHSFVSYEQLTSRPETTLAQLFARLDLAWEPEILEVYSSDRWITGEETWKVGVDRGVRPTATSERTLSEEQQERVRGLLRHDLYTRLRELSP